MSTPPQKIPMEVSSDLTRLFLRVRKLGPVLGMSLKRDHIYQLKLMSGLEVEAGDMLVVQVVEVVKGDESEGADEEVVPKVPSIQSTERSTKQTKGTKGTNTKTKTKKKVKRESEGEDDDEHTG